MVDKYLLDIFIYCLTNWNDENHSKIFVSIITITPLITTYSIDNKFDQLQALAQPVNTESNDTNYSAISERISNISAASPGQTIHYRGIEASKEPVRLNFEQQDRQQQTINILPHRDDGASYKEVLTFTATEPLDVGFGHRLSLDNSSFSQIESEEISELFTVTYNNKGEAGVPGIISAPSRITPDYGVNPPYFSAYIPFVGSSLFLSTMSGTHEPFVAVYEVSAEIIQPMDHVDLEGLHSGNNTNSTALS